MYPPFIPGLGPPMGGQPPPFFNGRMTPFPTTDPYINDLIADSDRLELSFMGQNTPPPTPGGSPGEKHEQGWGTRLASFAKNILGLGLVGGAIGALNLVPALRPLARFIPFNWGTGAALGAAAGLFKKLLGF